MFNDLQVPTGYRFGKDYRNLRTNKISKYDVIIISRMSLQIASDAWLVILMAAVWRPACRWIQWNG